MIKYAEKVCTYCKKSFKIRQCDANRGRGKFCGKSCAASGIYGNSYKHGNASRKSITPEYSSWASMINRVNSDSYHARSRYKDRGIVVCDRWRYSFEAFLEDMGKRPDGTTLDRINNDGNYEPSNCRWATKQEQAENTSQNVYIEFDGKRLTQEEWGRRTGIGGLTIYKRLKRGWSVEKSLTTPLGSEKGERFIEYKGKLYPIKELSAKFNISKEALSYRIDKLGWGIEMALKTPKRKYRQNV